jgi:uncharacterized protein (DUF58 family)
VNSRPADSARDRLLTPDILAGLGNLELVARAAVDGSVTGLHPSPRFGFSQEFAEYRAYAPGDDLRFIDWNVFARTDSLFIKKFSGTTNTRLLVVLDVSSSMSTGGYSARAVSKLTYARFVAAALIHLASRQHDAAGLLSFASDIRAFHQPSARALAIRRLYHVLEELDTGGETNWAAAMQQIGSRITGRSLVVLLSDCYVDAEVFGRSLKRLGVRGHDLLLLHLLTPEEKRNPAGAAVSLEDVETGQRLELDLDDLRAQYPQRLQAHIDSVRRQVLMSGGHYLQVDTDQPLNTMLHQYLTFRARHP